MRAMSGEIGTGGTTEVSAVWDAAPVVGRRRAVGQRDAAGERASRGTRDAKPRGKLRGSRVGMRRDALFRRMLLAADVLAIVAAFELTVLFSSRSLQLTWVSLAGVPILLVGAK